MADEQTVVTTSRTWKEECEAADKRKEEKPGYEFSNGRKFEGKDDPYAD